MQSYSGSAPVEDDPVVSPRDRIILRPSIHHRTTQLAVTCIFFLKKRFVLHLLASPRREEWKIGRPSKAADADVGLGLKIDMERYSFEEAGRR
jgi:hypothetical protein